MANPNYHRVTKTKILQNSLASLYQSLPFAFYVIALGKGLYKAAAKRSRETHSTMVVSFVVG